MTPGSCRHPSLQGAGRPRGRQGSERAAQHSLVLCTKQAGSQLGGKGANAVCCAGRASQPGKVALGGKRSGHQHAGMCTEIELKQLG